MKSACLVLAGLAMAPLTTVGFAQQMDFDKVQIITEQLGPNVYMLTGSGGLDPSHDDAAGGRIGVPAGPGRIPIGGSPDVQLADKGLAGIPRINTGPIRRLGNKHLPPDHTARN